jgi:hypothetical protein
MSINNKAKTRWLTKSIVLGKGKAKVMSYKDIKEAWAKRAKKDAIKGKGKHGQKRKSTAIEADEPDTEAEAEPKAVYAVKEVITGKRKRGQKRQSALQDTDKPKPEPEVAQTLKALVL